MEAYKKAIGNLAEILPFSKVFDQRYLNKTCKLESAITDVQKKIEQVKTDLETIESVCGKYKFCLLYTSKFILLAHGKFVE